MKKLLFAALALSLIGAGCSSSTTVTYKTYRNSACGISFEYPSDWAATEDTKLDGVTLVSPETTKALTAAARSNNGNGVEIPYNSDFITHCWSKYADYAKDSGYTAVKVTSLASLMAYLTANPGTQEATVNGQVMVDGQPATALTFGGLGSSYDIVLEHNGQIYDLYFPNDSQDTATKLSAAGAHILSSFKFAK